jgi:hypothetical protein
LQAKVNRLFHKKRFHLIVAGSSKDMVDQIITILHQKKAVIGNIWFDSHGHFVRRRSLFEIGHDEFSYRSLNDTSLTASLKKLSAYCDNNTKVGIGSCYGGSTAVLPAVENLPAQRMNGDSLMIGISHLLNNATVYACESFVMTAPGIFNGGYKLSGCPGRKKFIDSIYLPIWENMGEWNCYEGSRRQLTRVTTVTINHDGEIYCKPKKFLSFGRHYRKQQSKMKGLKRGNYNIADLYQVE